MHNHQQQYDYQAPLIIISIIFIMSIIFYFTAAIASNRKFKTWPIRRYIYFLFAILCISLAMVEPLQNHIQSNFITHMIGHLLLGMLAPPLLILALPIVLLFRTLNVKTSRYITSIMKSWPIRLVCNPFAISTIHMGGLWLLYSTSLYNLFQENTILHLLLQIHVFITGLVFTGAIIYFGPVPHQYSFIYRAVSLLLAMTGHSILSKYLFTHPPAGVSVMDAELGSMIMYYGGDAIELILIFIFFLQWFKTKGTKTTVKPLQ